MELTLQDLLEGNPVSEERISYSIRLWQWSETGLLPPDFLDYPAGIVEEVMYLKNAAAVIREEIAEKRATRG